MAPNDPHLPMRTFRPLVEHVRGRVRGPTPRLEQWDELRDDDRVSTIAAEQWLSEMSVWLRDPTLALDALKTMPRGAGDVVEFAAEAAATVGEALHTLARYAHLLHDSADFHVHANASVACLKLGYASAVSTTMADLLAGMILQGLHRWVGESHRLELWLHGRVLRFAPNYQAVMRPARVQFGSNLDAVVLPLDLLATPLPRANHDLHRVLVRFAESQSSARCLHGSCAAHVRRLVASTLGASECNVEAMARKLGMHQRAMARRLQDEGHTFSELLDDVRRERALHLMRHSNLPPNRIARMLSYRNSATFCRAFARWQGQSPLAYRRSVYEELARHSS